jgi:hypothetical protein
LECLRSWVQSHALPQIKNKSVIIKMEKKSHRLEDLKLKSRVCKEILKLGMFNPQNWKKKKKTST